MTWHSRSEWADGGASCADPYYGPGVRGVAIHWVGSGLSDALRRGDNDAVKSFLRACYARNRADGYCDIEYSLAVDGKGDVWECRGLTMDTGANGTTAANDTFVSILVIYPVGGEPTPAQIKGVQVAIKRVRARYPSAKLIRPHQYFVPTQCPGPAALRLIKSGAFEPGAGDGGSTAKARQRRTLRNAISDFTHRIRKVAKRLNVLRDKRQAKRKKLKSL